jgi:hypothetical protein
LRIRADKKHEGKIMTSKSVTTLLASAMLTLLSAPAANAGATTETFQQKIPVTITAFLDCTGELVEVSGNLHVVTHQTINGKRATFTSHFQPMGLQGYGTVSGSMYNATGVTRQVNTVSLTGTQQTFTLVNRFHFVGTGGAASFYVKQTTHLTVNANGEMTSQVDNFDLSCE